VDELLSRIRVGGGSALELRDRVGVVMADDSHEP
jgi:hypothetical protein